MTLTKEQIAALREGEVVTVFAAEVGADCVLVRADVFAGVQNALTAASDAVPREAYPAVLNAWDSVGSPDDAELYCL